MNGSKGANGTLHDSSYLDPVQIPTFIGLLLVRAGYRQKEVD